MESVFLFGITTITEIMMSVADIQQNLALVKQLLQPTHKKYNEKWQLYFFKS